jgi:hypothetical protein
MRAANLSSASDDMMVRLCLLKLRILPQLPVTAFSGSAVYTHDRQGDWTVGQRQGILLNPHLPRKPNQPQAHWKGLLSSRRPRDDNDEQRDSKAARQRDRGSEQSRVPAKETGPTHGGTGRKTKPLKPGLY